MYSIVSRTKTDGAHTLIHSAAKKWFSAHFGGESTYRSTRQQPIAFLHTDKARTEELEFVEHAKEFRRTTDLKDFPYFSISAIQEFRGDGWAMYDIALYSNTEYLHVFMFDDDVTAVKFKLTVM